MNQPMKTDVTEQPVQTVTLPNAPTLPRPARRFGRGALAAAIAAVAAIGGLALYWLSTDNETLRYTTLAVGRGDITRAVTATGTVNPVLTIIVGSYVSGVIQEIHCDYNTEVKTGQVCAKIDPRPYQSVVDQNRANLAVAKAQLDKDQANLDYAQINYDRNARLAQTNAISKDTLDVARNALDQARAQIGVDEATIKQRQAQLEAAEVNLGYTDIVSPVNGTVVSRNVTVGQTVAASFQTPTLFLIATDLTQDAGRHQCQRERHRRHQGGQPRDLHRRCVPDAGLSAARSSQVRQSPQTVQNVVTYDVVVSVDNTDLALKPGMTAATRIVVDERRDVLRVPSQALRYAPAADGRPAGGARRSRSADAHGRVWVLRDGEPGRRAGRRPASTTTASPRSCRATSSPATSSSPPNSAPPPRPALPRPRL